jgi:hypothetical protein
MSGINTLEDMYLNETQHMVATHCVNGDLASAEMVRSTAKVVLCRHSINDYALVL